MDSVDEDILIALDDLGASEEEIAEVLWLFGGGD